MAKMLCCKGFGNKSFSLVCSSHVVVDPVRGVEAYYEGKKKEET